MAWSDAARAAALAARRARAKGSRGYSLGETPTGIPLATSRKNFAKELRRQRKIIGRGAGKSQIVYAVATDRLQQRALRDYPGVMKGFGRRAARSLGHPDWSAAKLARRK